MARTAGTRATGSRSARAQAAPARVFHFSEDGSIRRFAPIVPPSNPGHPPVVWAIDEAHAPLYWFPRRCPRVSVWARDEAERAVLAERFGTDAARLCAVETGWLDQMCACRLYRYEFDPAWFAPSTQDVAGQFESTTAVEPVEVVVLDDLLGMHAEADIELRITPMLGTLTDRILESGLPFGFANLRDARR